MDTDGQLIDTDVLVIGAGAGGLVAALSAKRNARPGTRVTLVDARTVGRTGHTAFSNAWTVVVLPGDDLDGIVREIIAGNDWVADQELVYRVLAMSYERLKDLEGIGLQFPRDARGDYERRPTRGLTLTRVHHPIGGGLAFCWQLRRALEDEGVEILDRVFVTGLLRERNGARVAGAVGVHARTGDFFCLRAKETIICTNSLTFRSGFVRDITGTGTLLAYQAGAVLRNAEFSYLRPGTPKFYFEGITFAIQDGARFVNAEGEPFMERYEPQWGDQADVPRIARAMAMEKQAGRAPVYLDMSRIPPEKRDYYFHSMVRWMDLFLNKLDREARTDMFDKTPYYPQNQMTKLGIATDADCRSRVPGLWAAGLAQAGCANHFAGFHIGMCIGTGWIAGLNAAREAAEQPEPRLDAAEVAELRRTSYEPLSSAARAASDELLHDLQELMFRYDVSVWKHRDRLTAALDRLAGLRARFAELAAPHVHELVRLKETEAMLLAAEMILSASLYRTESRLSHFREDHDQRDDARWLCWVDIARDGEEMRLTRTPIPTPRVAVA